MWGTASQQAGEIKTDTITNVDHYSPPDFRKAFANRFNVIMYIVLYTVYDAVLNLVSHLWLNLELTGRFYHNNLTRI